MSVKLSIVENMPATGDENAVLLLPLIGDDHLCDGLSEVSLHEKHIFLLSLEWHGWPVCFDLEVNINFMSHANR